MSPHDMNVYNCLDVVQVVVPTYNVCNVYISSKLFVFVPTEPDLPNLPLPHMKVNYPILKKTMCGSPIMYAQGIIILY